MPNVVTRAIVILISYLLRWLCITFSLFILLLFWFTLFYFIIGHNTFCSILLFFVSNCLFNNFAELLSIWKCRFLHAWLVILPLTFPIVLMIMRSFERRSSVLKSQGFLHSITLSKNTSRWPYDRVRAYVSIWAYLNCYFCLRMPLQNIWVFSNVGKTIF